VLRTPQIFGHDTGPARPADPFATIPGADDDVPPF
jgi:hypothetical protein